MMMLVTLIVAVVAILISYSPLSGILGFKPLGLLALALIAAIVIVYFISAELVKSWVYRHENA